MPNIKTYDSPNLGLQPQEIGVESVAAVGRRGGQFFNQAAESLDTTGRRAGQSLREAGDAAVDYMDHQQISVGAAHAATLYSDQLEKKDAAIKAIDPNDPAYGPKVEVAVKKWREESLEPALENFKAEFTTEKSQAWVQHYVETTRRDMFTHSTADIANAAHVGIVNSVRTLTNVASNTVYKDPTTLDSQIDLVKHSIGGMVATSPVKGVDAARIQSEVEQQALEKIVKSHAVGAIQKASNPEAMADSLAAKYPQYISGAEAQTLARYARQEIRARNTDFETSRRREREAAQDKSTDAANQYLIDVRSKDPKLANDPTAQKILRDPNLLKADKNSLLNVLDRQNKEQKIESDPEVKFDLDDRMFSTDKPTTHVDILRAEGEGQLSDHDARVLRDLVTARDKEPISDPRFKPAMDGAKNIIEPLGKRVPPDPGKSFADFQYAFLSEYLKRSRAGTLEPNALNAADPKSLISQVLEQFKGPMARTINANGGVGSGVTPVPSATPGVSATPPVSLPPRDQLKAGQNYMTAKGLATWDGSKFKLLTDQSM